jgi:hypothetical protein
MTLGKGDPVELTYDSSVAIGDDVVINTNISGDDIRPWTFGADGNLTLPEGGDILDSTGASVLGGAANEITNTDGEVQPSTYSVSVGTDGVVTMTTSRGVLEFGALPEPGAQSHFHIMRAAGENADLYFGDDFNYVLQRGPAYNGSPAYGVEIGANDNNGGDQQVWRFGTDGTTTFPNDTIDAGTNEIYIQSSNGASLAYSALDGNWQSEPAQNQIAGLTAGTDGIGITLVRGDDGEEGPQWSHEWLFNKDGVLTLPGGRTRIGTLLGSDAIIANEDTAFGVVTQGTNGSGVLLWIEDSENFGTSNLAAVYTNPANLGIVRIATGANGGPGPKFWDFNDSGALTFPQGTTIATADGTDAFIIDGAVDKDVQIYTYSGATARGWTFGTDGTLTIPGDIRSEGNINIDINLSDSTLRRWSFGEDGHLIFPGGTNIIESSANSLGIYSNNPTRTNGLEIFGNTETNLFNQSKVRIISNVGTVNRVWEFGTNGSLTLPAGGDIVNSTGVGQLANRVESSWTVTTGTNTYSFTVPMDGTYTMWVKCNIPNGILVWNATLSISNSNVPAIGTQYAWNYTGGGTPISLTSIPDQVKGVAGTISTDATYAGTTSNRFDFGISNTSGASQIVYYGYTRI